MKRLVLIVLLLAQPAWAQVKPKDAAKRTDNCAPIGRTEDGKLVYSMRCEMPPKPVTAAPSQATPEPQAASEPETERTGLFGMSYDRRPKE
ncbi:hypothetical protein [Bradyrhizobium sp. STM 3557]|uniref:hypothetical protein n=1 Tax=Bradyrhizobium sp. STM 3557 TaxID=578920 RepID=UPI00388DD118